MKAPTTELKNLCELYRLSTRGNIHDIIKRLLDHLAKYRTSMIGRKAPSCFMGDNLKEICNQCKVQHECFSAINDLYRVRKHLSRFLLKQKRQHLKGKSK